MILRSAYLSAGTPPTVLGSHCILAVVSPDDEFHSGDDDAPNVFQQLDVLRTVAQKVKESTSSDKLSVARPAREAREALKLLDDDALQGVF